MRIREFPYSAAVQVDSKCSLLRAASIMRNHNTDCVVVSHGLQNGGDRPIGLLTDRDLAVFLLDDVAAVTVGELLDSELVTIDEGASTDDAIKLMSRHNLHQLPVTRSNGTLAGILTVDDVLHFLARGVTSGNRRFLKKVV